MGVKTFLYCPMPKTLKNLTVTNYFYKVNKYISITKTNILTI